MSIQTTLRKDGTKRYRANVYMKGDRLTGKWYKLKKQAQIEETELRHQLQTGTYVKETIKTFDECAEIYFDVTASKHMNANSIELEKTHYKNHIKPVFGHRLISSIKPYEIQRLWTEKEKIYSSSTIHRLHRIMNKIFKQFIKWNEIKHNPMIKVDKPRLRYGKTEVWSKKEVNTFLTHAKEYHSFIVFYIAVNTGMRMGEVLGLHWTDIDFDKQVINVTEALDRKTKKRGPLKTESSKRLISLTKIQIDVLQNHKKQQAYNSNIVCTSLSGTYFNPNNIRRAMKSISENANINNIRFHDLRHTHATLLLEVNAPIKAVQERLGHADVRITLDRYTHVSTGIQKETAQLFSDFLNQ